MNSLSPMEWDWENLVMLNASATETPKKLRPAEWEFDGVDSGSLYSSGVGGSGGSSGSDLGLASFSRSSKSSITSSSLGEAKGNKFTLECYNGTQNGFSHNKAFAKVEPPRSSPTVEVSVGSGEPLLGLKLGKRTYFEYVCAGNNAKSGSSSVFPASSVPAKRSKSSSQNIIVAYCQVEGCNLDLSSAKDYHRKHRVCANHSQSPKVVVGGLERRFCQQCSRFHELSEFDEKKRSCRRRLSDHNARRRKPPTELVAFNSGKPSASPYDGKHEISFVWNRIPFAQTKPNGNFSWDGTFSSKSTQMEGYTPTKVGRINGELQLPCNEPLNAISMHNHNSTGFLFPKAKCSPTEVLNQDVEESTVSSSMSMRQDIHRALSLLSTDSWGSSSEPKQGSLGYSMPMQNTDIVSHPLRHTPSRGFPRSLSGNWQFEQQTTASQVETTLHSQSDNHFQEFKLFRAPYDGFYSNRIN